MCNHVYSYSSSIAQRVSELQELFHFISLEYLDLLKLISTKILPLLLT